MSEESFLITNQGKRCRALQHDVERLIDYPRAEFDIIEYAMRNMGWIRVDYSLERQQIVLTFKALAVTEEALTAACTLLLVPKLSMVILKYDFYGWLEETYPDGSAAGIRIMEIAQSAAQARRQTEFFAVAKDPDALLQEPDAESQRLGDLLRVWQTTRGRFTPKTIPLLEQLNLLSRTLLIEPDGETKCGKFTFIGSGFTVYGENWPQEGIGVSVEEQFDSGYGQWVAKALRVIRETGIPQYEHVDARIRTPSGAAQRSRYKCLRTLWRDENSYPIMMTTSVITQDVDIPLFPVSATVV